MPHMVYKLDSVGRRRWLVGQLTAGDMAEGITSKPISRHGWSPRQGDARRFGSEPEARSAANAVDHAVRQLGLCQVMEVV
jgi:hypothetical protein